MVKIFDFTPNEMRSVMGRVFVSGSISASVFWNPENIFYTQASRVH